VSKGRPRASSDESCVCVCVCVCVLCACVCVPRNFNAWKRLICPECGRGVSVLGETDVMADKQACSLDGIVASLFYFIYLFLFPVTRRTRSAPAREGPAKTYIFHILRYLHAVIWTCSGGWLRVVRVGRYVCI